MSEPVDLSTVVAATAHELRSPLASLRGFAQLLTDRWPQLSDDDRAELLAQIDRDAQRMARLVDELLDVSRIGAGRLRVRTAPVELPELVDRVVASVTVQQPALTVDVSVASDVPLVLSDADRIAQVLTNLLENAAKYATNATARVRVARAGDTVVVSVDDDGPGLSPEQRDAAFLPHERLSRPVAAVPSGLGLGLWISRRVAAALGGTLVAAPNDHGGTSFRLTLPAG